MTTYEKQNYKKIYSPMKATTPNTIGKFDFYGHEEKRNLYKVTEEFTNWNIYTDRTHTYFYSIAKEGTGAQGTHYGTIKHIEKMIREGRIKRSSLTKLGYKLLGI